MNITVKCFAVLAPKQPSNGDAYPIEPGETIGSLLARLGIGEDEVKIMFVNGVQSTTETVLKEGDRVGLFPAVGGG